MGGSAPFWVSEHVLFYRWLLWQLFGSFTVPVESFWDPFGCNLRYFSWATRLCENVCFTWVKRHFGRLGRVPNRVYFVLFSMYVFVLPNLLHFLRFLCFCWYYRSSKGCPGRPSNRYFRANLELREPLGLARRSGYRNWPFSGSSGGAFEVFFGHVILRLSIVAAVAVFVSLQPFPWSFESFEVLLGGILQETADPEQFLCMLSVPIHMMYIYIYRCIYISIYIYIHIWRER